MNIPITELKEKLREIDFNGQDAAQYPLLITETMPKNMRQEANQILDEVKRNLSNSERKALAASTERNKSAAYFYVLARTQNEALAKAVAFDAAMLWEATELGVGYADGIHVLKTAYSAGRLPNRSDYAFVHNLRKSHS